MKVFLHYEEPTVEIKYQKSLKITLPKSWKAGPSSNLLKQFVESYNANPDFGGSDDKNPLDASQLHLAMRQEMSSTATATASTITTSLLQPKVELIPICSDAIVIDEIPDRMDVYICHGPSQTVAERKAEQQRVEEERKSKTANSVSCVRFGCQNRFPKGGPYPKCVYHKSPPIFHETAKWWSCCPDRKAWDFDEFQKIPGCCTGVCTDVKGANDVPQKLFLGGSDLREQASSDQAQLRSIDDFNIAQTAGGSAAAPVLDRLKTVFVELGIEQELFDQVVNGIRQDVIVGGGRPAGDDDDDGPTEAQVLEAIKQELGTKFKTLFKSIAVEQLRIK